LRRKRRKLVFGAGSMDQKRQQRRRLGLVAQQANRPGEVVMGKRLVDELGGPDRAA
jgi:hypothetical protein